MPEAVEDTRHACADSWRLNATRSRYSAAAHGSHSQSAARETNDRLLRLIQEEVARWLTATLCSMVTSLVP
jgi:hypothetical protein